SSSQRASHRQARERTWTTGVTTKARAAEGSVRRPLERLVKHPQHASTLTSTSNVTRANMTVSCRDLTIWGGRGTDGKHSGICFLRVAALTLPQTTSRIRGFRADFVPLRLNSVESPVRTDILVFHPNALMSSQRTFTCAAPLPAERVCHPISLSVLQEAQLH
ncbi:hypothetical protein KUCAC02_034346, partial [Chaenocephalus aceratus]